MFEFEKSASQRTAPKSAPSQRPQTRPSSSRSSVNSNSYKIQTPRTPQQAWGTETEFPLPEDFEVAKTTSTRLLDKRRELLGLGDALQSKKSDHRTQLAEIKAKEQEIAHLQSALQLEVSTMSKSLQDNDLKKDRANKKAEEERVAQKEKAVEVDSLRTALQQITKEKTKVATRAEKYERYKRFLEETAAAKPGDFSDPKDIEKRYETLVQTLKERENEREILLEKKKTKEEMLEKYKRDRDDEVLDLSGQLSILTDRLEEQRNEVLHLESQADLQRMRYKTNAEILSQVLLAVDNLYAQSMSVRQRIRVSGPEPISKIEKLTFIGECLTDLLDVTTAVRHRLGSSAAVTQSQNSPAVGTGGGGGSAASSLGPKIVVTTSDSPGSLSASVSGGSGMNFGKYFGGAAPPGAGSRRQSLHSSTGSKKAMPSR